MKGVSNFEKALRAAGVDGWRAKGPRFPADEEVLVLRVQHKDGREGVCKASNVAAGRVRNENVYVETALEHAQRLGKGGEEALPTILQRHRVWGQWGWWWRACGAFSLGAATHRGRRLGEDWCYFVMEDGGETLLSAVEEHGALSLEQVASIAVPLLRALEAIHLRVEFEHQSPEDGQTHNDIKPSNILISERGKVTLIDMDVASAIRSEPSKKPFPVAGSYEWSGANGLAGFGQSPKDDLDALGQVLIWAVTGKRLWRSPASKDPKDSKWRLALAAEKKKWSSMSWPERANYVALPKAASEAFRKYYAKVDKLKDIDERPNYDDLCAIWSDVYGSDGGGASSSSKATTKTKTKSAAAKTKKVDIEVEVEEAEENNDEEEPQPTKKKRAKSSTRGGSSSSTKKKTATTKRSAAVKTKEVDMEVEEAEEDKDEEKPQPAKKKRAPRVVKPKKARDTEQQEEDDAEPAKPSSTAIARRTRSQTKPATKSAQNTKARK